MTVVDINSDLGEGFGSWKMGDDLALLDVVTSANIACGFHAGDPTIMRSVCAAAVERGVAIGAHVSYPDLSGFGRRFIDIDPIELRDGVLYQLGGLDAIATSVGGNVAYVKAHGALFNAVVHHRAQAAAVVSAVAAFGDLPLVGLPESVLLQCALDADVRPIHEAYIDRAYTAQGALVDRREPGAVLHDVDEISERAVRMVADRSVRSIDGETVQLDIDSVCVHGDTPGAVAIAVAVRAALESSGVTIRSFVR